MLPRQEYQLIGADSAWWHIASICFAAVGDIGNPVLSVSVILPSKNIRNCQANSFQSGWVRETVFAVYEWTQRVLGRQKVSEYWIRITSRAQCERIKFQIGCLSIRIHCSSGRVHLWHPFLSSCYTNNSNNKSECAGVSPCECVPVSENIHCKLIMTYWAGASPSFATSVAPHQRSNRMDWRPSVSVVPPSYTAAAASTVYFGGKSMNSRWGIVPTPTNSAALALMPPNIVINTPIPLQAAPVPTVVMPPSAAPSATYYWCFVGVVYAAATGVASHALPAPTAAPSSRSFSGSPRPGRSAVKVNTRGHGGRFNRAGYSSNMVLRYVNWYIYIIPCQSVFPRISYNAIELYIWILT